MKRLLLLLPVILVACGSQVVEFPEGSEAAPPAEDPCNCPPAPVEQCTNGVDDDGDGLVDCADPDCENDLACATLVLTPPEKVGTDAGTPPVEDAGTPPVEDAGPPRVEQCTNGVDDDGDQLVDCADPDCAQNEACLPPPPPPPVENCSNGKDDDGDELVDCADPDCANDQACSPPPPVDAGPPPDLCSSDAPKTCEDALHCCMNVCKPLVQGGSKRAHDEHVSCVQNCANDHKVCVKKRQCDKKHQ